MVEEIDNGIKIGGWGAMLEARGHWVASSILAIIMVVGFIIMHDGQIVETLSEANYYLEIRNNQDYIIDKINKLHEEQEIQTWLMSIPFEARPKILTPEARAVIEKENEATRKLYNNKQRKR